MRGAPLAQKALKAASFSFSRPAQGKLNAHMLLKVCYTRGGLTGCCYEHSVSWNVTLEQLNDSALLERDNRPPNACCGG